MVLFIAVVAVTRYISLGSIIAAGLFPFAVFMLLHPDLPILLAAVFSGAFIVWRHKANIARLQAGNENVFRFGSRR